MPKVLSSITVDAPTGSISVAPSDTFAFTGSPTFSGSGGTQRYDFKWEVDSGGGYVTIAASGTGLITAGTNPVVNTNSTTPNSITVTADAAGTYTIRMVGAPTSGGSYTVISATRSVTVLNAYAITANSGTYSQTGQAATITKAHVLPADNGSYSLTGQAATIDYVAGPSGYEVIADSGTYSLTGQTATITYLQNFPIAADFGTYSVSGQAATLLKSNILVAEQGTYTQTGQDATVFYGVPPRRASLLMEDGSFLLQEDDSKLLTEPVEYMVISNNGTITITGQSADLSRSYNVAVDAGSYTLTGQTATVIKTTILNASSGTYSVTGQSATILRDVLLTAQHGTYPVTGQDATIVQDYVLPGDSGTYSTTGQSATIKQDYVLTADSGTYSVSGQVASVYVDRVLDAFPGTYTTVGRAAAVVYASIYPDPSYVLEGITYGPGGIYIGTMVALTDSVKVDLVSGKLVKPINNKVVMTL